MIRARIVVVAALLAILASCATTGQIPVELEAGAPVFISPANQDGVQDAVTLDLLVSPLERTRVVGFTVEVVDAAGTAVYSRIANSRLGRAASRWSSGTGAATTDPSSPTARTNSP